MEVGGDALQRFFAVTSAFMDERQRRLQTAAMAQALGRGGQARVAAAAEMSRNTIIAGAKELAEGPTLQARVRRPGAGPKRRRDVDPEALVVLDSLVEPESRGDPMSPLRWTLKSTRRLAEEMTRLGHKMGASLVGELLHYIGYSLQANAKVTEGRQHPDRDGQFRYINSHAKAHLDAGQPVISVDCKKKENVGDYANVGAEWEPQGQPTRVGGA